MTAVNFDPAFVERISSARPAEMTAMLLEAAIEALKDASEAIHEGAIERRFMSSAKAMKIVGFLHETLNYEEGGDVAVNLDKVYRLAMARIARINPFNEALSAEAAIRVLTPQAEAWRRIDAEDVMSDVPEIETLPPIAYAQASAAAPAQAAV